MTRTTLLSKPNLYLSLCQRKVQSAGREAGGVRAKLSEENFQRFSLPRLPCFSLSNGIINIAFTSLCKHHILDI